MSSTDGEHAASDLVIDKGEHAITRPVPEDPIAALRGAHAGPGPTTEQARAAERAADAAQERRRFEAKQ